MENWLRKKCASCGQGFLCGAELREGTCWCNDLPLIMEVPGQQDEMGCYCPECLKDIIQEKKAKGENESNS